MCVQECKEMHIKWMPTSGIQIQVYSVNMTDYKMPKGIQGYEPDTQYNLFKHEEEASEIQPPGHY